jgi:integrase
MEGLFCKPIIRASKNRLLKDGKAEILIYYHHIKTVYFKTGIIINPIDWNPIDGEFSSCINRQLKRSLEDQLIEHIEKIDALVESYQLRFFRKPQGSELKKIFKNGDSREPDSLDILNWYWQKIESNRNKQSSKDVYIQSYRYLEQYLKVANPTPSKLEQIDLSFILEFKEWLKTKKSRRTKSYLSNVTINKQINNLRYFLRQESQNGRRIAHEIFHLKLEKAFTKRVFLSQQETESIINLEVSGLIQESTEVRKRMRQVQDMIHFNIFYGLRCSDLLELRVINIRFDKDYDDHYLHFRVKKTGKELKLPIIDEDIIHLLKDYQCNKKPSDNLFGQLSLVSFNNYLKKLAEYAEIDEMINMTVHSDKRKEDNFQPKWKFLSSHSLRKTSINLNLKKYDREIAKSISGHTSENGFKAYEEEMTYDDLLKRMLKFNQF